MDPTAASRQLTQALFDEDFDQADELARALLEWLDRGGFPPDGCSEPQTRRYCTQTIAANAMRKRHHEEAS